jgi:putative N-acetylmannosamine-6-phosphate epimerase/predicted NBD/HSP70 family sugar kinase
MIPQVEVSSGKIRGEWVPAMSHVLDKLKGRLKEGLVVSCQAAPGDPLEDTDTIRRIARAVAAAGAAGLRVNSPEHIAAIRKDSTLPIIGIQKRYTHGAIHITPDFAAAAELAAAGASVIALDCTERTWPDGEPWRITIERIHRELELPVMADIATLEEALAAAAAGADMVGTTLHGYTERTCMNHSFNWSLLADMVSRIQVPVIAEGHISSPEEATRALSVGAWCVIVGSAITRPATIATTFIRAMNKRAMATPAIGVDIGGTSIKAGLVDPAGEVILITQVPTQASRGREVIAAGLCEAIRQILSDARDQGVEPSGLGIASAGAIDAQDGSVFAATDNLPGWANFQLRSFAEKQFNLPTWIVNDAHAAVLAELHFGLGRSLSDFVAITLGTGVGGGIICGRKLLTGRHGFAGSIGHHVIREGGRECNCGRRGCLEAYVSTAALIREYGERGGSIGDGQTIDGQTIDGQAIDGQTVDDAAVAWKINQLAATGDPAAVGAYQVLGEYLAEGVANIFNLFDPEAVLISGGLVEGQPQFVARVGERVAALLHFGSKRKPCVKAATAGRLAGVQGAAALVFEARQR